MCVPDQCNNKNSYAFLNAVITGEFSIHPRNKKYVGHYLYLKTVNHGDERPEIVDTFRDMRTGEIVEVYVPQY